MHEEFEDHKYNKIYGKLITECGKTILFKGV